MTQSLIVAYVMKAKEIVQKWGMLIFKNERQSVIIHVVI